MARCPSCAVEVPEGERFHGESRVARQAAEGPVVAAAEGPAVVAAGRPVVVTAADAAYALPLAVMLRSAVEHLAPGASLEAFVLDDGMGEELRRKVRRSLPERLTLHWTAPPAQAWHGLPLWGRMPATTYCKLLMPSVLPEGLSRVLWLDADILVRADLGALWRRDLGEHTILASADPFVRSLSSRFGVAGWRELDLPGDAAYFNAGVMLVDLARWRRDRVTARAEQYLRRFRDRVIFHDQEALNAVLAGAWGPLDGRWNRGVGAALLGRADGDERAAAILHYSGSLKPWRLRIRSRYQAVYYGYLDRTAWASFRPPWSLLGVLLGFYQSSPLRRALLPLEQRWFLRRVERSRRVVGASGG